MKKSQLETLPEHLIKKILEFFQTKRIIKIDKNLSEHEINQLINLQRTRLINGQGIKTDLQSIIKFSSICKRFYDIVHNSDIGKLLFAVHYNSKELKIANKLVHISYCHNQNCTDICHYVNKDVKYSNIIKKIALNEFNEKKKMKNADIYKLKQKYKYFINYSDCSDCSDSLNSSDL